MAGWCEEEGDVAERRRWLDAAVEWPARHYFDVSYGLLEGSDAGRRLLRQTGPSGEAVHGYTTSDDLEMLHADLAPRPGQQLLDLGSGIGGIALAIHRRSGAAIVGVDLSPRAIGFATREARRAGLEDAVRFTAGTLTHPPVVGAANAYALDSLMFVADPAAAIGRIVRSLEPGGRLFATMLVVGGAGEDRLRRTLRSADVRIERFDDVTDALRGRSRSRSDAARALLQRRSTTFRGRLAMLLVIGEEAFVQALIARRRAGRYRFLVSDR